jgi:methanogenic corrinoid protein MtbC1
MIQSERRLADSGISIGEPLGLHRPSTDGPRPDGSPGSCHLPADPGSEHLQLLVSTVESQIIPRLVIAHRSSNAGGMASAEPGERRERPEEVRACIRLLLDSGAGPIMGFAEALLVRGLTLDAVYLDVFAPAARGLGDLWERDQCSFTDVTIALGRLQQTLRRFAAHFRPEFVEGEPWRRAMFAAVPGEQHTLGLSMIVQYFLRAGWDASMVPSPAADELPRLVQQERVTLVGLSMSQAGNVPVLKALIARIRASTSNPALRIVVGGVAFSEQPALADEVGADGTAIDAAQAVNLAQQLVL